MENSFKVSSSQTNHAQESSSQNQQEEFGDLHFNKGEYQEALKYYQDALQAKTSNEAKDLAYIVHIATLYEKVGSVYSKMSMWTEALQAYEKCKNLRLNQINEMFNQDQPEVNTFRSLISSLAETNNQAGKIYKERGLYNEVESCFGQIWYLYDRANLEKDETFAHACIEKGFAKTKKDLFGEASAHFEEALEVYTNYNKNEDLDAANMYEGRAMVHRYEEDFVELQKCLKKALEIRTKVLGNEDLSIAKIYDIYTRYYLDLSETKKAKEFCNMSLQIKQKKEGVSIDLAESYCGLGLICQQESKFEEAINYFKMGIDLYIKEQFENHPGIIEFYNHIASVEYKQEKYDEALEHCNTAETIISKQKWFDPNHLLGDVYEMRGLVYGAQKDFEKSYSNFEQCNEIRSNVLGRAHTSVAYLYNHMGNFYSSVGEFPRAIQVLQASLKVLAKRFGEDHINLAGGYDNLAVAYDGLNDTANSVTYHEKAKAIREKHSGNEHSDIEKSK